MGIEENKKVALQYMDAISSGRWDEAMDLMADDCTWWVQGSLPSSRTYKKKSIVPMVQVLFATGTTPLKMTIGDVTAEGDRVCVESASEMEVKNGKSYRNTYHYIYYLRDGKIVHVKEYCDTQHLWEVIGEYMPPKREKPAS